MRAGRLRHKLNLQQQTETQDALGGAIITWTTTATVWGGVEALSGSEAFVADQVNYSLQVRIVIRHGSKWSSISPTWRVVDVNTGRKYDIKSVVLPEHRSRPNTVIELLCVEGETDDE
jgi:SPP1 family predicted phage head-tail adaptor